MFIQRYLVSWSSSEIEEFWRDYCWAAIPDSCPFFGSYLIKVSGCACQFDLLNKIQAKSLKG